MRRLVSCACLVGLFACAAPERDDGSPDTSGTGGASGSGTAGSGTSGSGTSGGAGSGTSGSGTSGSGTAGTGTSGSGTAGTTTQVCTPGQQVACACPGGAQGAQACNGDGTGYDACVCPMGQGGSGTAGSGTAGTGTSGSGTAGTGTSGSGTAGTGTAGSGTAGTGTSGSGTAGSGVAGSGTVSGADKCPGTDLTLTAQGLSLQGTTAGMGGDYDPLQCASAASSDVVYHFVAPVSGMLTATVTPTKFDAVVYYATGTCSSSPKKCSANVGGYGEPEVMTFAVTAGTDYWLFVDGWTQGFAGDFTLTLTY